ncbi:potassium channel family protein [Mycoplasmopsis verecunda]|uniref:Voltage-gated potassium channel n=1 Tax=Mycoplasmopsis verecunda TaxID=171291 RepID=A0A1T4M975_9BACT|nr:potassium channel family protein [Mycoplasmopsis verecunda]WPB54500.1 potassium channel family protein [Mycoplasmopsis verecunda]SJZ63549.1 voltage-gated potassium channel [Mycoplasmopsis verecunda]
MQIKQLYLDNKPSILKIISLMTWSNTKIPNSLTKEKSKIRAMIFIYAGIITFSCLVSFLALVQSSGEHWNKFLASVQILTFFIFIIDYALHLITYQVHYKLPKLPMWKAALRYIFSFNGIIILFCILASFNAIAYLLPDNQADTFAQSGAAKFFNDIKSLTIFKMIRFFFILTLFAPFQIITQVFTQQRKVLTYVFILIIILIILFALIIWNNEANYLDEQRILWMKDDIIKPNMNAWLENNSWAKNIGQHKGNPSYKEIYNFIFSSNLESQLDKMGMSSSLNSIQHIKSEIENAVSSAGYPISFWNAIYFTTITLTTIGYGDYVPHAPVTKGIVIFISLVSIAIIAIPSGLIAGSFLSEMQKHFKNKDNNNSEEDDNKEEIKEKMSKIKNDIDKALNKSLDQNAKTQKDKKTEIQKNNEGK